MIIRISTKDIKKFVTVSIMLMMLFALLIKMNVHAKGNASASEFINEMNAGWNLGDSLESYWKNDTRGYDAHLSIETLWGNPKITKELIDFVSAQGFNTIRIPVTWYYNTGVDEQGRVRVGVLWLARVKEVVDYAIANDMYVILNTHHDEKMFYTGVTEEEMSKVLADALTVWTDIAYYFKDYDNRLIFEGFNEVDNMQKYFKYGELAASQMNQLNQVFVNAVRTAGGNNINRILIVPTLLHGTDSLILRDFVLPTDIVQDRLVIAVHNYSICLSQDVENLFSLLGSFSQKKNAPVIITECGNKDSYEFPEFRTQQVSNYFARAKKYGIKCVWWDDGYSYKIIDRKDFSKSNFAIINAIFQGLLGKAMVCENYYEFASDSQFVYLMPILKNGNLENTHWGTITTTKANGGIKVQPGQKGLISLYAQDTGINIWLQRIVFYDAAGNFLSGKELQKKSYIFEVPANASYILISMNDPYRSIPMSEFSSLMNSGNLKMTVSFIDSNSCKEIMIQ